VWLRCAAAGETPVTAQGIAAALQTAGLLVLVALPASTAGGGLVLLPWARERWSLAYWGRLLARHGVVVAGLILMLVPEIIESQLDPAITARLPAAWQTGPTAFLAGLENGWHHGLQAALPWTWLRLLFTAIYVAGYPFIIVCCVMLPVWMDRGRLARRALAAYAICFAAALPFYLFMPVNEVWAYYGDGYVHNVINDYPLVREHLYSFNDINNCFPSLHTAISVALAALVWRSNMPRRLRVTAVALASGIVFSTLYLGIHWLADVLAGLALAAAAAWLATRWFPDTAAADPLPASSPAPRRGAL